MEEVDSGAPGPLEMTSSTGTLGITRTKDGVPQWSGEARSFQEYEELCLQWEQGIAHHKRDLCGPRLLAELSGTARKYAVGKKATWLSFNGGVAYLMDYLRKSLGKPQIPELSENLNRYFRQGKRQRQETMNEYIVRKTEAYARAKQSMSRVLPHHKTQQDQWDHQRWRNYTDGHQGGWYGSGWQEWNWGGSTSPAPPTPVTASSTRTPLIEEVGGENYEDPRPVEAQGHEVSSNWTDARSRWSQNYPTWEGNYGHYEDDEKWTMETPELIPDFLQGWYLLADSGLDSQEKNLIQTAVGGNYALDRIAQELRTQWPDDELRRRDQQHRHSNYWQDEVEEEHDEDEDVRAAFTADALMSEGMNETGIALMADAEESIEEALTVIKDARRTLREARAKQHQVKMNRQYYRPSNDGGKGRGKDGGHKGEIKCFRCGGNHKIANCPDRQAPRGEAKAAEEVAPFVCFHDNLEETECYTVTNPEDRMTTSEAVRQGFGVIDGGATRTLGSVVALEAIAEKNRTNYKDDRIVDIDPKDTPAFGFGNSSQDTCCSTTTMKITAGDKPGFLKVHTLDKGEGPVLLSISTLRALGALIDFEEDLIVFRKLDDRRLVQAMRSASGHQLLPLTEDSYRGALQSSKPIPSLRDFCI